MLSQRCLKLGSRNITTLQGLPFTKYDNIKMTRWPFYKSYIFTNKKQLELKVLKIIMRSDPLFSRCIAISDLKCWLNVKTCTISFLKFMLYSRCTNVKEIRNVTIFKSDTYHHIFRRNNLMQTKPDYLRGTKWQKCSCNYHNYMVLFWKLCLGKSACSPRTLLLYNYPTISVSRWHHNKVGNRKTNN